MSEIPPYPPIEPTTFDLIVIGTGLPESVIAAAASAAGKTVLHLDPNPFYGSHFASLPLHDLQSFLTSHSTHPDYPSSAVSAEDHDFAAVDLTPRNLYSDVEISPLAPEIADSRKFSLDLAGPRALFCADKTIDLILKSGANQYMEFKSIDACFVCDEDGKLVNVPDSRAAIFKDKKLSFLEKNQLMKFFKLVQGHMGSSAGEEDRPRISDEDLASPFVDFLTKMRLPPKIKAIILYAIAMADYDQENLEACKFVLKTKDGIERLAMYNASVGRFHNALGALIYPIYGQGELPQAFCRRAAVKGSIYVLRMPVNAVLMDKDNGQYKGVRLATGQDLFSQKLVLDPSYTVLPPSTTPDTLQGSLKDCNLGDVRLKVARAICITRSSLKPDVSNLLVVYPPRSFLPEQDTSVRALQISSNLAVCPDGMFVLYLSVLCEDANQGKKLLSAAMKTIFTLVDSASLEGTSVTESEDSEEAKPFLLWSAMYVQEVTKVQQKDKFRAHLCNYQRRGLQVAKSEYLKGRYESITSAPMPDGGLNYNDMLDASRELFEKMYPDEEFFKETPEDPEDDGDHSPEATPEDPEDSTGHIPETSPGNPEDDGKLGLKTSPGNPEDDGKHSLETSPENREEDDSRVET